MRPVQLPWAAGREHQLWTTSGTLYVGSSGTGTLNINAGGIVNAGQLANGNVASTINFDGGTLRVVDTGTSSDYFKSSQASLSGGGTIEAAGVGLYVVNPISGIGAASKNRQWLSNPQQREHLRR